MEKNSRTEMLSGKRDFYRCCKARRSTSHVNKEFWQQFQNYAPPSLWVIRTKFARTIIIGERAKRARHSQVCAIENRIYTRKMVPIPRRASSFLVVVFCIHVNRKVEDEGKTEQQQTYQFTKG